MSEKVSSTALKLNRLKHASEAYQEHKRIHTEYDLSGLVDPDTGKPEADEMAPGFQSWPEFREAFLTDWTNNRRVVDEKEADVHFDTLADEALNELDSGAVVVDVNAVADTVTTDSDGNDVEVVATAVVDTAEQTTLIPEVIATPKRRGRPPGSGKAKAVIAVVTETAPDATAEAVAPKRRGRPPGSGKAKAVVKGTKVTKLKKVAAKKKGGNKSEQAQAIVERYAARDWSRKDIIEKLQSQIDVGAAYAATLYQKFA